MGIERIRGRIDRTRRHGRWAFGVVVGLSALLGLPLLHAVVIALGMGRADLITWGVVGVGILVAVDLVAWLLLRRQKRLLDSAEEMVRELEAMGSG